MQSGDSLFLESAHGSQYSGNTLTFHGDALKDLWIWQQIVQQYSVRELTDESDRLLAISGLTKRFSDLNGVPYLAGLWQIMISRGLQWFALSEPAVLRTWSARNPSWSWISCARPVAVFPGSYREYSQDCDAGPRVVDASVDITDANPLGRVSGGTITLSGKTRDSVASRSHQRPEMNVLEVHASRTDPRVVGVLRLDRPETIPDSAEGNVELDVKCLLLDVYTFPIDQSGQGPGDRYFVALALRESQGAYRRIALMQSLTWPMKIESGVPLDAVHRWFDGVEESVIRIV